MDGCKSNRKKCHNRKKSLFIRLYGTALNAYYLFIFFKAKHLSIEIIGSVVFDKEKKLYVNYINAPFFESRQFHNVFQFPILGPFTFT